MRKPSALFALFLLAQVACAVRRPVTRTALVSVRNNTTDLILGLTVVHKFSSLSHNHTSKNQWAAVLPGSVGEGVMSIQYTAGGVRGRRNHWLVTWFKHGKNETSLCYSSSPRQGAASIGRKTAKARALKSLQFLFPVFVKVYGDLDPYDAKTQTAGGRRWGWPSR